MNILFESSFVEVHKRKKIRPGIDYQWAIQCFTERWQMQLITLWSQLLYDVRSLPLPDDHQRGHLRSWTQPETLSHTDRHILAFIQAYTNTWTWSTTPKLPQLDMPIWDQAQIGRVNLRAEIFNSNIGPSSTWSDL